MLRADALTVVHHDDTTSHFEDVSYALDRDGLRVVTAAGQVTAFPINDILTTLARLTHQRRPVDDSGARPGRLRARGKGGWAALPRGGEDVRSAHVAAARSG